MANNILDDVLHKLQLEIETNRTISHIRSTKYYKLKKPSNHIDLLNFLVICNVSSGGFVSVSKVIKDFIDICTSKSCNINLSMSEDSCIEFVKNSIKKLDFVITKSYQRNTRHYILQFSVDLNMLDQVYFNLPMITTPRMWVLNNESNNGILGGYLHNNEDLVKLIKSNNRLNNSDTLLSDRLIRLVNNLQNIKFSTKFLHECYEIHKLNYESNLIVLENMVQNTKYEKSLYYIFVSEKITRAKILIKCYDDFIRIVRSNNIKSFHLLFNVCFRGRIYASGLISPTSDKVLRRFLVPEVNDSNVDVIEMDASASVLQILATISCSSKLANITNLITDNVDTWSHIHKLIIGLSVEEIDEILSKYFSAGNTKIFLASDVYDTINLIDRNIVKYTIMRILYGSNPYQISIDLKAEYSIANLSYKHITVIYAVFFYNFEDEINVLKIIKLLNKYMVNQNSSGISASNKFISYSNTYYKTITRNIRFRDKSGKLRDVDVYLRSSDLDLRKSTNASCPNLFHNIDSEICLSIIETFLSHDKFIFTIHDAFIIRKSDELLLIRLYNQFLYDQHNKIINLIESHIDLIVPSHDDLTFINNYLGSIKARKLKYNLLSHQILSSQFTLKSCTKREIHTSKELEVQSVDNLTYVIDLKSHVNEVDVLLNVFADKLLANYPDHFVPGYLQIYSRHIQYIGGPNLRVSTKVSRLDRIHNCIDEFRGKLEHYGTASASYIPIIQTLKFTYLNDESLNLLKKIDEEMKTSLVSKPESMSDTLWLTLENIVDKINLDLELPNMGILDDTKNLIVNHIKLLRIDEHVSNNANPKELKYNEIVKFLDIECSKPACARNAKQINAKRTLANYYVKKYGLAKKH
jgi:hypothetical protein